MTTMDNTVKTAQKLMDETRENAGHAAGRAHSALVDGMHAVTAGVTLLRSLGIGDALRWAGLQRRQSPMVPFLTFGAGFVAGAALGVLVAPMTGADTRRALLDRVTGAGAGVKERAQETATDLADKANDAAHSAQEKAKDAVHGVQDKAKDAVKAGENKAKDIADQARGAAKNALDDASQALDPNRGNGTNRSDVGKRPS
jgi:gas vesicle protein